MGTVPGDGTGVEPYRVNVGLDIAWQIRAWPPLIQLEATPDFLEFRARLGLGRFFGPWRVEREQVTKIFRGRRWLNPTPSVSIWGKDNLDWIVFTYGPAPLLLTLEELGYPVDWLFRN